MKNPQRGDCRLCANWVDENLNDIPEPDEGKVSSHLFFGCKIYGNIEDWQTRAKSCPDYQEADELYALCSECKIIVPKVCISMGVCVNCLNTDLFCVESCIGGELKKFCTHYVRLKKEGAHVVSGNTVFDIFPPSERQQETKQTESGDAKLQDINNALVKKKQP